MNESPQRLRSHLKQARLAMAMLLMLALVVWPAWTMLQLRGYIARPQDRAVETIAQWQAFETHFKPLREAFPPGTVLAYQRSSRAWRDDRRIHDVAFACIPLIVAESWYVADRSDLILADLADDDELHDLMAREGLTLVRRFAPGLAVLRKPAVEQPS